MDQKQKEDQTWALAQTKRLKEELEKAREAVKRNHKKINGLRAVHLYSFSIEQLLISHIEEVCKRQGADSLCSKLCILAVGGFGRQEIGLYSDLDFVFVVEEEPSPEMEEFLKAILRPLFDLRLDLGYGLHTVKECLDFLGNDISKTTALLNMRFIWGNETLAEELEERLQARLQKNHKLWFVKELEKEMRSRHNEHGDTVFLLEPDLKHSRGAIRDIHQVLWISFALFGVCSFEAIMENGLMSLEEKDELFRAWAFLVDIRNSLHMHVGRKEDRLSLERQIPVAQIMNYKAVDYALGEELLMREYYEHALVVERLSLRMLKRLLEQSPGTRESLEALELPRVVARDFHGRAREIWIEESELTRLHEDKFWHLKFFVAASRYGMQPTDESLRMISKRCGNVDESYRSSDVARDFFLTILSNPGHIAQTLRAMHHAGLLCALIPEFALIKNLPRLDHYHQYTVDEHSIRSIAVAESLLGDNPPRGMEHVSEVAKEILRIDLLLFSLLLHDVGKGEGRGHVIRGMHIIQRVAERMKFRPIEQVVVRSLVADHQKMTHIALRRDVDDPAIARELGEAVEDPEQLKMLYVHSVCDMTAVSTESWNEWRGRLLAILYERTLEVLRGIKRERQPRVKVSDFRDSVWDALQNSEYKGKFDRADVDHFLSDMQQRYLRSVPPDDVVLHMAMVDQLSSDNRISYRLNQFEDNNPEITFVARSAPGLFSNLCGALASKGFNIQFAQIYTATSGEAIDIFQVTIPEQLKDRVEEILDRICERMNRSLKSGTKERWTDLIDKSPVLITQDRLDKNPPKVIIDNDSNPDSTIIEIHCPDRPGLLSEIAGLFDKFSINIDLAIIATESFHLVDVFYVTDLETNKLTEGRKLKDLEEALKEIINVHMEVSIQGD